MVSLIKTNSMQLSLTWIWKRNTETYKWNDFPLHYWAPKQKTKKNIKTNKQTYTQAFSITYISMILASCWKRPRNVWSNVWRIVQWSISKIFIPKQHQIRIANVILCTSYWKWQNPRIERIWWNWTAKDTNGLLVSLCPPFYMRMRGPL